MRKKITISIPIFNEEQNIILIVNKIKKFFKKKNYNFDILFSDNSSTDKSVKIIEELCKKNKNIKLISFKKNYGYDISLLENYKNTNGDAVISIDADMQDPINIINKFILKWESGYDLVYGIRIKRKEPNYLTLLRKLFYLILKIFSKYNLPLNSGDFRLIDNTIIKNIKKKNFKYPYSRAITFSFSRKSYGIEYSRNRRIFGRSKFGILNLIRYALRVIYFETNITEYLLFIIFYIMLFSYFDINNYKYFFLIIITIILSIFFRKFLKNKKNKIEIKNKINL